jgi:glycosyltransferase involved in cell wall biosynthesis
MKAQMKSSEKRLKVAIIAPPWLSLYPGCYYGIENVVHHLAANLTRRGHHVELFSVGNTKTEVTKLHWYHKADQYKHIHRPYYEVTSISISHLLYSLNIIREAGDFDIIHDHNSFIGPATLAYAADLPPILHTLHEPFTDPRKLAQGIPDNRLMFDQFKNIKNLYFNAVSYKQKSLAPDGLMPRIKGVIYNGVDLDEYIYSDKKEDYFTIVASMSPDKGQATAARAAKELGVKLKMAGTIGGDISTPEEMARELADAKSPLLNDRYFNYFKDEVAPHLIDGQIEYIGKISGDEQKKHFAKAKAFLFPIDWEEPFGMAVIDALASGTPVIAYRRGAMPEIIEHGVNGFLADNYEEFKRYMKRVGEIDPAACRKSAARRFSTEILADNYEALYRQIIEDHSRLIRTGQLYKNLHNILPISYAKKIYGLTPSPRPRRKTA